MMTKQTDSPSEQMSPETAGKSTRILVGLDVSGDSNEALIEGLAFATLMPKTKVDVAWVPPVTAYVPEAAYVPETAPELNQTEPELLLRERVKDVLRKFGPERLDRAGTEVSVVIGDGRPAQALGRLAFMNEADMIIVAASDQKGKLEELLLGSVAKQLVQLAPCPVLVMRPRMSEAVPEVQEASEVKHAKRRLGIPHRYSGATRNQKSARENMPLLFPQERA